MKIFAIIDELNSKPVAYLLYYENDKKFYIELPDDADPWETPLLLSSFLKRGEKTVNAYWSKLWVQQRIVPPDRQNLGQILKANGLDSYDEFALLMLANGRCAQDDYYLVSVPENELPAELIHRFKQKLEDVIPLADRRLLVFFRDGSVKKCDMNALIKNKASFSPVVKDAALFQAVALQPGGHGVCWGENLNIAAETLYTDGEAVPLSLDDFRCFVERRIINTSEAASLLDCSRQNIEDLVRRDKLHPIKASAKNKLFLKSEVLQRSWQ